MICFAGRRLAVLATPPHNLERKSGYACPLVRTPTDRNAIPDRTSPGNGLGPRQLLNVVALRSWRTELAQATDKSGSLVATTGPFGDMPLIALSHIGRLTISGAFFSGRFSQGRARADRPAGEATTGRESTALT